MNRAAANVGKILFFDKKLSKNNSISCATCHDLKNGYGTDLSTVSTGIYGQKGERNSPTVFNSALNFTQFWDGRAKTLHEQAALPIVSPVEMGMSSIQELIVKLKGIDSYRDIFNETFSDGLTRRNLLNSIEEFQKTLVTVNSPFDQYLRGKEQAITEVQKRGYRLFKSYGCISCHQGKNVGGNMFQKMGALKDISLQLGSLANDLGRFNVTNNEWDKRVFKVPSLRLAAVTPPYFHDGSVKTLEEAVQVMTDFQLGRDVPQKDKQAIVEFIKSLVGQLPKGIE